MLIRPLFSQELHFFKEKISIEIYDEYCVLSGEYFFENLDNSSLTRVFYYPVVVNKSLHFPHFFKVNNNQLNQEIPFTVSKKGISFMIKISPNDTTSFKVEYHQKATQKVFEYMLTSEEPVDKMIEKLGLKQVSDSGAIEKIIEQVIKDNPNEVEQYRSGKEKLIGFFVGQVMKASKGKANPQLTNQILKEKLK